MEAKPAAAAAVKDLAVASEDEDFRAVLRLQLKNLLASSPVTLITDAGRDRELGA